ncbi:uncharacterized protein LOC111633777 [Centruroides sculpturatus]|uniref:uncharacterized protein LOC111633772 n=1 Tax=Centruroides sculpturatus TaxID=218467 RepID=UPI000C6DEF7C|nr:uncharacterized protein LOC111633772 [Centruroides sculpturatus]XP_023234176.1 uncharacterized protein LOC111633777 [Centruroides sculpturatus]
MNTLTHPEPFSMDTSNPENRSLWKQRFDIYATAIDLPAKSIPQQRAILLHIIGEKGLEIYINFHLEENATNPTVDEILTKFTDHFQPYKNIIYSRYVIFSLVQNPGQTVDEFVTELRTKAQECDFDTLTESLIRDRIVLGTRDDSIRQKMLQDPTLTLAKAIDMARSNSGYFLFGQQSIFANCG